MKKTLIVTLVLLFFVVVTKGYSQSYKFLTTGFSVLEKNSTGSWGKWSKLEKAAIVINLDTTKNRIIVYSQEIQLYTILSYDEKKESDTDLIYTFNCEDDDKEPFTISIMTRKKQNNRKQLYITQKNVIIVYNIENFVDKNQK